MFLLDGVNDLAFLGTTTTLRSSTTSRNSRFSLTMTSRNLEASPEESSMDHRQLGQMVPARVGVVGKKFSMHPLLHFAKLHTEPWNPFGSSFRDNIDDSSGDASKFREVIVRLNLEFLDVVDDRRVVVVSKKREVIDAIQQEHVASVSLSIHGRESERSQSQPSPTTASSRVLAYTDWADPWCQCQQLGEVASIQRQIIDRFVAMTVPSSEVVDSTADSFAVTFRVCCEDPIMRLKSSVAV